MKLQTMCDIYDEFGRHDPPEVDAAVTILAGDIDTELQALSHFIQEKI